MKQLKRILALIGVLFFAGLYIVAFVVAFLDIPYKTAILQTCIFSTFFLALFIAAFTAVLQLMRKRNGTDQE